VISTTDVSDDRCFGLIQPTFLLEFFASNEINFLESSPRQQGIAADIWSLAIATIFRRLYFPR
jgi:hypothetical protein